MDSLSDVFGAGIGILCLLAMFFLAFMFLYMAVMNIVDKFKPTSKLMSCESCGKTISTSAYVCPHCGQHYGTSSAFDSILVCLFCGLLFLFLGLHVVSLMLEEYGYNLLDIIKGWFI
ncbi:hypothetical protein GCM10008014_32670 [Paenibacillus silvae]|uniref:C2H2-type domain-containing protein n=1 Tax=Paenibacillus silvae TaxID=1325358 RepID=A0ABQ1ZG38_9BACL|nr:hypothetical protein [Paenibacillus silvae]GGH59248.1 hypothetical protein GCM10008014_32670 [Paenibacillus silvae]